MHRWNQLALNYYVERVFSSWKFRLAEVRPEIDVSGQGLFRVPWDFNMSHKTLHTVPSSHCFRGAMEILLGQNVLSRRGPTDIW